MTGTMSRPPVKLRVVQWATGNVGAESLKAILLDPRFELVGVRVFSDAKHGVDAGQLCGLPDTGVRATNRMEEILALDADCVAYMPRHAHLDEVCALLESGKNVICTPFLFYGEALATEQREQLRGACEAGRSSVHGTGIHPGFAGMVLPLAMAGMSRSIRHIRIQEKADWSFYNSPRITFDNMRFGHPPEEAALEANAFARFNASIFEQQIHMLGSALGAELDEVTVEQELAIASEAYDVMAGHVAADSVNGQRYRWRGQRRGETLIEIDALWTLGGSYPEGWPKPREGWTIAIEGEPSLQTHFLSLASFERSDATMAEHVHASDIATAMQAVNTIPSLCEAPAGIRGTFELRPALTGIGFRR